MFTSVLKVNLKTYGTPMDMCMTYPVQSIYRDNLAVIRF